MLSNEYSFTSGRTPYTLPLGIPDHILVDDLSICFLCVACLLIFDAANVKALLSNNQINFNLIN